MDEPLVRSPVEPPVESFKQDFENKQREDKDVDRKRV